MRAVGALRGVALPGMMMLGALAGCGSGDESSEAGPTAAPRTDCPVIGEDAFVCDVGDAARAVDELLGAEQEFFEVTANAQATSVFVALDEATAAQQYVVVDGVAEPLGERLEGASGQTFVADAIDFDPAAVLAGAQDGLPSADFIALSVEGGPNGAVRYVMATASGTISVALDGDGRILAAVE